MKRLLISKLPGDRRVKMKTKIILLCLASIYLQNCYECVTRNDTVSCDSIGPLNYTRDNDPPVTSESTEHEQLIEECSFKAVSGQRGSREKEHIIYTVIENQDSGIRFYFYNNQVISVHLFSGWKGKTKQGLKLNDSLEKFLSLYENAEYYNRLYYYNDFSKAYDSYKIFHDPCIITAYFNTQNKLSHLIYDPYK